jgi:hypothetical protein
MRRALLVLCCAAPLASQAATITIHVTDGAGAGFNDATPVAALPTNSGTTRGAQRLNLFQFAAARWGERLQSSVPIIVDANWSGFSPADCSDFSGVLGFAGPDSLHRDFPNAPQAGTWYPSALANALRNADNDPTSPDIDASFNPNVDSDPGCLGGDGFYYGTDHNPGRKTDLLNVLMHELGHGLGFTSFVNQDGTAPDPGHPTFLGIFDHFLFDESLGKFWTQLTAGARASSSVNTGNLVWNGINVDRGNVVLDHGVNGLNGHMQMYAPNPFEGGSSVSHWDEVAVPNVIMEPVLDGDDRASEKVDLTTCLLKDIGWTVLAPFGCPDYLSDLSVQIAEPGDPILAGAPAAVTLTATNHGGDRASNVTVDAQVSGASATLNSVSSSQGGCTALPCNLGLIDNQGVATVTLNLLPAANGMLDTQAQVVADERDTLPGNDGDEESTTVGSGGGDTTPDAFRFAKRTGVGTRKIISSNTITIAGIDSVAPISFNGTAGGKGYSINGGAFVATPGHVVNGDTVRLHLTSSSAAETLTTMRLTIGDVSGRWTVTTGTIDTTPDQFTLVDVIGVAPSTVTTSEPITISGITAPVALTLGGSTTTRRYSINGGAFTNASGATVSNGDSVRVQAMAANALVPGPRTVNVVLNLGGIRDTWSVTTAP